MRIIEASDLRNKAYFNEGKKISEKIAKNIRDTVKQNILKQFPQANFEYDEMDEYRELVMDYEKAFVNGLKEGINITIYL